jgi:hypothetical protein
VTRYSLDFRSLALFRIALGSVLIGDLIARAQDLRAFYTDFGVLPRHVLLSQFRWPEFWSLHVLNGAAWFQIVLFVTSGLFALMLLIGYKTRVATIASWLLLLSLQARNPYINHAGDVLLRLLLFWAMFLPLGKRFGIDALWDLDEVEGPRSAPVVPSIAFTLQVVCVYLFAFLWKAGPEWHNGTALEYALNIEQMATPFGQWLLEHPALLPALTYVALYGELAVAVLLLLPWQLPRFLAVIAVVALQLGFGFALRVGHFPYIAIIAALALLPPVIWTRSDAASSGAPSFPRVWESVGNATPLDQGLWVRVTATAALIAILWFNASTLGWLPLPRLVESPVALLRLDQEWSMFAPRPLELDGFYVILGTDNAAVQRDVWRHRPFDDSVRQKPSRREMNAQYPSERWAVYMMDLHKPEMRAHLPLFAAYLCRLTPNIATVEINFIERVNQLDRSLAQPLRRQQLWSERCQ